VRRRDLAPVTIPMASGVESLNVGAAAAGLRFVLRRRLEGGWGSPGPVPAEGVA
jgi:tRNA G18 (ribose-2'-O)-methylase SpoU